MRIKPFTALCPPVEVAASVSAPPYDTIEEDQARAVVSANPRSFLRISRPEADMEGKADPHGPEAYARAASNFAEFRATRLLVREANPGMFLYRLSKDGHSQTGVVACCHTADYGSGVIKRHEKTRIEKENDRAAMIRALRGNTEPVLLAYRDRPGIDACVSGIAAGAPRYDFTAADGVRHTLWAVAGGAGLDAMFAKVPGAYIADGHHRAAAAARVAAGEQVGGGSGECGDREWFLGVLFPASQLNVMPYNRCLSDLNGLSEKEFAEAAARAFKLEPCDGPSPVCARDIRMYMGGRWHRLTWNGEPGGDPVASLDVSVLQDRLLGPAIGVTDPRTDKRLIYVGGIHGTAELVRLVDCGRARAAFSMFPTSVEQVMAVSDSGRMMPPKSTWFEPKPRSGLFVQTF
ncbi:MAG: DUF1015 domain-containing protein [Lentisphaerae bacterium]|nr:DUF1015 domain-containing protein [Lentisphaerota bacterium]